MWTTESQYDPSPAWKDEVAVQGLTMSDVLKRRLRGAAQADVNCGYPAGRGWSFGLFDLAGDWSRGRKGGEGRPGLAGWQMGRAGRRRQEAGRR